MISVRVPCHFNWPLLCIRFPYGRLTQN